MANAILTFQLYIFVAILRTIGNYSWRVHMYCVRQQGTILLLQHKFDYIKEWKEWGRYVRDVRIRRECNSQAEEPKSSTTRLQPTDFTAETEKGRAE